jgi:thiamine transport system ATP-binding protein
MRLEVQDLRFRYEDMEMRFDLVVESGEFMAIIGPSGAGKSTLLALIGGFETPISGRVLADGDDICGLAPSERPVTTLFQEHNLFAHLTVFANVALGIGSSLRLTDRQKSEVGTALASVGLSGLEQRLPGELSGGERQRAALARCLVRHRPILLLDEPFAALGPGLRQEMMDLVLSLQTRLGLTILMVTHDPADARYAADRTAFVADGSIVIAARTAVVMGSDNGVIRAYLGRSEK